MSRREDRIFFDQIDERHGGSAYHHFNLSAYDAGSAIDILHEVAWIAPRAVRVINNRFVSTVLLAGGQANTLDVVKDVSGGTDRAVITQFDPDVSDVVLETVYTPTLSEATADDTGYPALPHVACPQYGYFNMIAVFNEASTGPYSFSYMAHFSFEDLG